MPNYPRDGETVPAPSSRVPTHQQGEESNTPFTINRRKVLWGLGAIGLSALVYKVGSDTEVQEEIMAMVDPEVETALKVRGLFEKIEETKNKIAEVEKGMDASAKSAILQPGVLITKLKEIRTYVQEIIALTEEVKATGFRVNSAVAYNESREIDGNMGALASNASFSKVIGFAGKAGLQNLSPVKIPGLNITINPQQSMQVIAEKNGLKKDLVDLKKVLGEISDVDIDGFSNNKHVNKEKENPREMLRDVHDAFVKHLYIEHQLKLDEEKLKKDPLATIMPRQDQLDNEHYVKNPHAILSPWSGQFCSALPRPSREKALKFLSNYGLMVGNESSFNYDKDANYDMAVNYDMASNEAEMKKRFQLFVMAKNSYKSVMRTAYYSFIDYGRDGKTTKSSHIRKLQEMLARGGYFDYRKFDDLYGKDTNAAFYKFLKDSGIDDYPDYIGLDPKRIGK